MTLANRPLRIALDGADLDVKVARCAASAFVRQTLDAPSLAEISFAEPPDDGVKALKFGAELSLRIDSNSPLFTGEITTLEHSRDGSTGHVVRLRAYDKLHRLRKKQRARAIANISAGDLVSQAASDLGLQSAAVESGPSRTLAVQYEQNDLEFVTGIAAESGLHLYLDDGTLRLLTLAGEGEAIELKVGRDLASVRSVATLETLRHSTKAQAWDVLRTLAVGGSAPLARQDAEDMRSIDLNVFGDLGVRTLYNRVASGAAEAQGLAQADIDRAAQGEIVIEGKADGNPRLQPGRAIKILGVSDDVDGEFTITEALHLFTENGGYITEFSTAPPPRNARARAPVFTFGRVFDVSDSDRLSRVRARFTLMDNLESDWMPVVVPGAGKEKGFAVMPENDDDVLILFPDGNPAYGIVFGGLYGESKAPGLVDGGTRPFVFRTANGQTFMLDAANSLARIETSGGDQFELGPKGTYLHATQDLLIEAPGRTVTIRAKAVEFEEA